MEWRRKRFSIDLPIGRQWHRWQTDKNRWDHVLGKLLDQIISQSACRQSRRDGWKKVRNQLRFSLGIGAGYNDNFFDGRMFTQRALYFTNLDAVAADFDSEVFTPEVVQTAIRGHAAQIAC